MFGTVDLFFLSILRVKHWNLNVFYFQTIRGSAQSNIYPYNLTTPPPPEDTYAGFPRQNVPAEISWKKNWFRKKRRLNRSFFQKTRILSAVIVYLKKYKYSTTFQNKFQIASVDLFPVSISRKTHYQNLNVFHSQRYA